MNRKQIKGTGYITSYDKEKLYGYINDKSDTIGFSICETSSIPIEELKKGLKVRYSGVLKTEGNKFEGFTETRIATLVTKQVRV